jgi:hypothetical protein
MAGGLTAARVGSSTTITSGGRRASAIAIRVGAAAADGEHDPPIDRDRASGSLIAAPNRFFSRLGTKDAPIVWRRFCRLARARKHRPHVMCFPDIRYPSVWLLRTFTSILPPALFVAKPDATQRVGAAQRKSHRR